MVHADAPVALLGRGLRRVVGDRDLAGRLARRLHLVRDPLGLAAHVAEHQRRADVLRQPVGGAGALRQRRHRARERRHHVEANLAQAAAVDHLAGALGAGQVRRDPVERRDGRREPDPAQRHAGQLGQRLQQQRELRAALGAGQGVDLVDDHRLDVRQPLAVGVHRDHQRQRRRRRGAAHHQQPLDVAGVDAQLERGRADHRAEPAAVLLGLGAVAQVVLQRAVVDVDAAVALPVDGCGAPSGDRDLAGRLARRFHLVRDPLGLAAHVAEHQRRADVLRQPVGGAGALRQRRHRAAERRHHVEANLAQPAAVDDRAGALAAGQVGGDPLQRRHRRREPDPPQRHPGQLGQRLQQQRQLRAALVAGQRVDLVHDHRLDVAQRLAVRVHRDHQRQRLGRGQQHVRRAAASSAAAPRPGCRRCARRSERGSRAPGRGGPGPARCWAAPAGPSRAAAGAGCARRRSPAPAAARRRGSRCGPAARRRRAARPAATSPAGRPPASCRCRSASRSGRARPRAASGSACACGGVAVCRCSSHQARDGRVQRGKGAIHWNGASCSNARSLPAEAGERSGRGVHVASRPRSRPAASASRRRQALGALEHAQRDRRTFRRPRCPSSRRRRSTYIHVAHQDTRRRPKMQACPRPGGGRRNTAPGPAGTWRRRI